MATNNSSYLFGWQLLNKLYEKNLEKKEDVIILLVHWYFLKCGFKCIGLGDSKILEPSIEGSELLPEDWNKKPNYAIRYIYNGKLLILHGITSDADILLNLLRAEDHTVTNAQFPIAQTVNAIQGPLDSLIPSYQTVIQTLKSNLLNPICISNNTEVSTQTITESSSTSRDNSNPLMVQPPTASQPQYNRPHDIHPTGVGRADLFPFESGQGMLFDPFSGSATNPLRPDRRGGLGVPGRLPPGAVPPGARFDPFGPPDINPRRFPSRGPDNDHLPPPGYDDMFM